MNEPIDITAFKGLSDDSRAVKKGYLFAAIAGARAHGETYIEDALRNGATGILVHPDARVPQSLIAQTIQVITDENPRKKLAQLAAAFYARQPAYIAAVTGTNGKTSAVHFTKQIWQAQGLKAATIGTLGVQGFAGPQYTMTTPGPVALHAALADMAGAGIDHAALEASSHGLDQFRLDGVNIRAGAFTNLTQDHLDYHGDMDRYGAAKMRLFAELLPPSGTAVLNADSEAFASVQSICKRRGLRVLSYGAAGQDFKIVNLKPAPGGQALALNVFGKRHDLLLPLVGSFQVMNALCALGLVAAEDNGSKIESALAALETLKGAPGRLQPVPGHPCGAAVYIDYAHTPDALETVLKALRPHAAGKLVCVFGCGGDRDRGKRPLMGEIASRLADAVIVTDDNPRSENPSDIRAQIIKAAPHAKNIGDRREAIREAVRALQKGDVLVIAGKGHEQGQVIQNQNLPFDDFQQATQAIQEI